MNKEDLSALVAQLLQEMGQAPQVKATEYHAYVPEPQPKDLHYQDGDFVDDVTKLDLRRLYLVDSPADAQGYRLLKEKTPARLGFGRAGPRYKTLTQLRFRADHAAAQDAVFSELPDDFGQKHGLISLRSKCRDKDEYLTRPDLGRTFDEENQKKLSQQITGQPRVLLVVGDGLSGAAIAANAADCMAAIEDGLKMRNIPLGKGIFVKYCRVGASDAIGDITGCELVCMLVGERPGLVTDKSMSVYLTYKPHTGIAESCRTVVSNIHAQGTPAVEAGAYVAELIDTILKRRVSGVALHAQVNA